MNKPSYPYYKITLLVFLSILLYQHENLLAIKLLIGAIIFLIVVWYYRKISISPIPNHHHKKFS